MSDDDVGGDDGDAGGRGGGGDAGRGGVAKVRDDDVGGDGRDDDESVSRGGMPSPLSDGSGATPGGGAAGSEASETAPQPSLTPPGRPRTRPVRTDSKGANQLAGGERKLLTAPHATRQAGLTRPIRTDNKGENEVLLLPLPRRAASLAASLVAPRACATRARLTARCGAAVGRLHM